MEYRYVCEIRISFPTAKHAEQTKKVMEVDREVGDRVVKSFALEPASPSDEIRNVLKM
jgi:hypothetical protein